MEGNSTIVDRIRILANSRGLSLTSLEVALKLGNGTISRWNKSSPNSDKLMRVADYFHVPIDYLLGRDKSFYGDVFSKEVDHWSKPISINGTDTWSNYSDADFAALSLSLKDHSAFLVDPVEIELLTKFRMLDKRGQAAVLNVLNHEFESLPGEEDISPAKNA